MYLLFAFNGALVAEHALRAHDHSSYVSGAAKRLCGTWDLPRPKIKPPLHKVDSQPLDQGSLLGVFYPESFQSSGSNCEGDSNISQRISPCRFWAQHGKINSMENSLGRNIVTLLIKKK